jgi:hypothetical protein
MFLNKNSRQIFKSFGDLVQKYLFDRLKFQLEKDSIFVLISLLVIRNTVLNNPAIDFYSQ